MRRESSAPTGPWSGREMWEGKEGRGGGGEGEGRGGEGEGKGG